MSRNYYQEDFAEYSFDEDFQISFDEFMSVLGELDLSEKTLKHLYDIFIKDTDRYFDGFTSKYFTREQIENVINNSVCDYDCLVEKLNEMMYPEEFDRMKNESEENE